MCSYLPSPSCLLSLVHLIFPCLYICPCFLSICLSLSVINHKDMLTFPTRSWSLCILSHYDFFLPILCHCCFSLLTFLTVLTPLSYAFRIRGRTHHSDQPVSTDVISVPDFLIQHYFPLEGMENVPRNMAITTIGK